MKMFYLISAVIVTVLVLVLSFAQVGASCTWYLVGSTTPPVIVLLQTAALGAIIGGLLILYWKTPGPGQEGAEEEGGSGEGKVE